MHAFAVAVAAVAGALLVGAAPAAANAENVVDASGRSTIRVVGEGKVTAKPDVVEVDLGVISRAKTAGAAAAENAKKLDRVMEGLKKLVAGKGEVKTIAYTASPNHTYPERGGTPRVDGYTVTNTVRVRLRDVAGAGKIIDTALSLGANEVQRLAFTLADEQPVQSEALRAAATKARAQANALASALGVRIVRILNVTENASGFSPVMYAEERSRNGIGSTAMAATPIEPGSLEIRASVTATYEISPGK